MRNNGEISLWGVWRFGITVQIFGGKDEGEVLFGFSVRMGSFIFAPSDVIWCLYDFLLVFGTLWRHMVLIWFLICFSTYFEYNYAKKYYIC